jgi:hypothetical protein
MPVRAVTGTTVKRPMWCNIAPPKSAALLNPERKPARPHGHGRIQPFRLLLFSLHPVKAEVANPFTETAPPSLTDFT